MRGWVEGVAGDGIVPPPAVTVGTTWPATTPPAVDAASDVEAPGPRELLCPHAVKPKHAQRPTSAINIYTTLTIRHSAVSITDRSQADGNSWHRLDPHAAGSRGRQCR